MIAKLTSIQIKGTTAMELDRDISAEGFLRRFRAESFETRVAMILQLPNLRQSADITKRIHSLEFKESVRELLLGFIPPRTFATMSLAVQTGLWQFESYYTNHRNIHDTVQYVQQFIANAELFVSRSAAAAKRPLDIMPLIRNLVPVQSAVAVRIASMFPGPKTVDVHAILVLVKTYQMLSSADLFRFFQNMLDYKTDVREWTLTFTGVDRVWKEISENANYLMTNVAFMLYFSAVVVRKMDSAPQINDVARRMNVLKVVNEDKVLASASDDQYYDTTPDASLLPRQRRANIPLHPQAVLKIVATELAAMFGFYVGAAAAAGMTTVAEFEFDVIPSSGFLVMWTFMSPEHQRVFLTQFCTNGETLAECVERVSESSWPLIAPDWAERVPLKPVIIVPSTFDSPPVSDVVRTRFTRLYASFAIRFQLGDYDYAGVSDDFLTRKRTACGVPFAVTDLDGFIAFLRLQGPQRRAVFMDAVELLEPQRDAIQTEFRSILLAEAEKYVSDTEAARLTELGLMPLIRMLFPNYAADVVRIAASFSGTMVLYMEDLVFFASGSPQTQKQLLSLQWNDIPRLFIDAYRPWYYIDEQRRRGQSPPQGIHLYSLADVAFLLEFSAIVIRAREAPLIDNVARGLNALAALGGGEDDLFDLLSDNEERLATIVGELAKMYSVRIAAAAEGMVEADDSERDVKSTFGLLQIWTQIPSLAKLLFLTKFCRNGETLMRCIEIISSREWATMPDGNLFDKAVILTLDTFENPPVKDLSRTRFAQLYAAFDIQFNHQDINYANVAGDFLARKRAACGLPFKVLSVDGFIEFLRVVGPARRRVFMDAVDLHEDQIDAIENEFGERVDVVDVVGDIDTAMDLEECRALMASASTPTFIRAYVAGLHAECVIMEIPRVDPRDTLELRRTERHEYEQFVFAFNKHCDAITAEMIRLIDTVNAETMARTRWWQVEVNRSLYSDFTGAGLTRDTLTEMLAWLSRTLLTNKSSGGKFRIAPISDAELHKRLVLPMELEAAVETGEIITEDIIHRILIRKGLLRGGDVGNSAKVRDALARYPDAEERAQMQAQMQAHTDFHARVGGPRVRRAFFLLGSLISYCVRINVPLPFHMSRVFSALAVTPHVTREQATMYWMLESGSEKLEALTGEFSHILHTLEQDGIATSQFELLRKGYAALDTWARSTSGFTAFDIVWEMSRKAYSATDIEEYQPSVVADFCASLRTATAHYSEAQYTAGIRQFVASSFSLDEDARALLLRMLSRDPGTDPFAEYYKQYVRERGDEIATFEIFGSQKDVVASVMERYAIVRDALGLKVRPNKVRATIKLLRLRVNPPEFSPQIGQQMFDFIRFSVDVDDVYKHFMRTLLTITEEHLQAESTQLLTLPDNDDLVTALRKLNFVQDPAAGDVQKFYAAFFAQFFRFYTSVAAANFGANPPPAVVIFTPGPFTESFTEPFTATVMRAHTCFNQLELPPRLKLDDSGRLVPYENPPFQEFFAMVVRSLEFG